MVEVPETILFGAAIGIFIPLFIFLIKMIMETANTKNKMDLLQTNIQDMKDTLKRLANIGTDIKIFRLTIKNIEKDIMDLFSKKSRNTNHKLDTDDDNGSNI